MRKWIAAGYVIVGFLGNLNAVQQEEVVNGGSVNKVAIVLPLPLGDTNYIQAVSTGQSGVNANIYNGTMTMTLDNNSQKAQSATVINLQNGNVTVADSTNGTNQNGIYIFNNSTGTWGIHSHSTPQSKKTFNYVAGVHGSSGVGFAMVVDEADGVGSGIRIYQANTVGLSTQALVDIRTATKWQDDSPLGLFQGWYLRAMQANITRAGIGSDG